MIRKSLTIASALFVPVVVWAQGPPPGGHMRGPGGFERFGFIGAGPASGAPVTGAPYSAVQTTEFQQTLANGTQITRQQQTKVTRDSYGRVRSERTFTPPNATAAKTSVVIYDPVASAVTVLDPANATAFKRSFPPRPASSEPRAPHTLAGDNVVTENLGTQVINGLTATGTRKTTTIPAGAIGNSQALQRVREVWISTDLKVPVMIKNSDPMNGTTVTQLTNVVRSEPDASLFQVPSNYTVHSRDAGEFRGPGARGRRAAPSQQ